MTRKIKEIANEYEYTGITRVVFVYITGPIAASVGWVTGFVKGVIHSTKG